MLDKADRPDERSKQNCLTKRDQKQDRVGERSYASHGREKDR